MIERLRKFWRVEVLFLLVCVIAAATFVYMLVVSAGNMQSIRREAFDRCIASAGAWVEDGDKWMCLPWSKEDLRR